MPKEYWFYTNLNSRTRTDFPFNFLDFPGYNTLAHENWDRNTISTMSALIDGTAGGKWLCTAAHWTVREMLETSWDGIVAAAPLLMTTSASSATATNTVFSRCYQGPISTHLAEAARSAWTGAERPNAQRGSRAHMIPVGGWQPTATSVWMIDAGECCTYCVCK